MRCSSTKDAEGLSHTLQYSGAALPAIPRSEVLYMQHGDLSMETPGQNYSNNKEQTYHGSSTNTVTELICRHIRHNFFIKYKKFTTKSYVPSFANCCLPQTPAALLSINRRVRGSKMLSRCCAHFSSEFKQDDYQISLAIPVNSLLLISLHKPLRLIFEIIRSEAKLLQASHPIHVYLICKLCDCDGGRKFGLYK